ncbi:unnamed protein product, partial [Nippostrongylus brasiliensis]|uniref:DUF4198 domain-containing protein n=1 Tax=Nippostrongylus brasiliensis TaxID=27835 RepID=A0A0N4XPN4_NIPBR
MLSPRGGLSVEVLWPAQGPADFVKLLATDEKPPYRFTTMVDPMTK